MILLINACKECVISYAPRVLVASGTVLLTLHRGLRVGLLDIDVVDYLRHPARETSLNQPQPETLPAIATREPENHNPTTPQNATLLPEKIFVPRPEKRHLDF